jgi:hypothetical protein
MRMRGRARTGPGVVTSTPLANAKRIWERLAELANAWMSGADMAPTPHGSCAGGALLARASCCAHETVSTSGPPCTTAARGYNVKSGYNERLNDECAQQWRACPTSGRCVPSIVPCIHCRRSPGPSRVSQRSMRLTPCG